MEKSIYNYLESKNLFKEKSIAKNYLEINENEVSLIGNRRGLVLLADYILDIALNNKTTHIHLDNDNFFDNKEYLQLIIEYKDI